MNNQEIMNEFVEQCEIILELKNKIYDLEAEIEKLKNEKKNEIN
jgi:hypothetical protein